MSVRDCLVSDFFLEAVSEHRYSVPAHSIYMPHARASALVVFFSICALGNMLTLLGGAKCTRVNWEQGLSDVSGYLIGS